MSINMEPFGWQKLASAEETPKQVFPFGLQCRSCGYEPEDPVVAPRHKCPKCSASSWERYTRPGSLLDFADRRQLELVARH
jgi:hypothetical protein